jgi:hypothetical protein
MVTLENWEEYAILRADGELDAVGKAALEAFLSAHPELAEEAEAYDSLRLVPDEAVVFAGKESLLKPEPRVIRFDRRWMYGVAAGVALLIGSLAVMRSGEKDTNGPASIAGAVSVPVRSMEKAARQPATNIKEEVERTEESTAVAQNVPSRTQLPTRSARVTSPVNTPARPATEESAPSTDPIEPLLSADTRMLAVTPPTERRAANLTDLEGRSDTEDEILQASRNLLDRLPVDRSHFALVNDLRSTASDRIQNIRQTREKIRNTDVTIAVGRRDLFTLRF